MVTFDAAQVRDAVHTMASAIAQRRSDAPFAVVGIRRGGEHLARRLALAIEQRTGEPVQLGMVDITLYRDDGFGPNDWPEVGTTQLPFEPRSYTIVLVDDVLYTGRTVRAALDVILDYGRPKAVRLAVLVDRGLRELPIGADVAGFTIETRADQHVSVQLTESGAPADAVLVTSRPADTKRGGGA